MLETTRPEHESLDASKMAVRQRELKDPTGQIPTKVPPLFVLRRPLNEELLPCRSEDVYFQ